ncbi:hypothetical protein IPM62_05200 [Candidatus Woesebacteria bacterium]|nr:MAG: hypothetical protein IPM62_05200 [Candidatus Woesebacteria bacterium]
MSIALLSLAALLFVIIISCVIQRLNPGLLSLLATLIIGTYVAKLPLNDLIKTFPIYLFLLLISMGIIFGVAQSNKSMHVLTFKAINLIRGRTLLLPILFFLLAFGISAAGPGNIASVALLAPLALPLAKQYKVSSLITTIMICTGANAGAFSPFSPTGIVAIGLMHKISIDEQLIWVVFIAAALLQSVSALVAYSFFLLRSKRRGFKETENENTTNNNAKLDKRQKMTLGFIALLIILVTVFKVQLLIASVSIAVLMFIFDLADEEKVLKKLPWSTILMVTGIAILIGLLEKTGGLDIATTFIATNTNPKMVNGVLATVTGVVSAYSSSSGVVMPAFIPLIPKLAMQMGIINMVPMVIAVAVGSHMVDVSPLSTLGALCIAAIDSKTERTRVFRLVMMWGLAMSLVGGLLAYLFLDIGYNLIF